MRLADHEARARLESHDHGILCTVHAERGVDAVPVAYAVDDDGYVGVPIDLVKPKASLRLQRERNLEADPRATLLIEHWDRSDWSRLWWVRAELRWQGDTAASRAAALAVRLAGRYPQYQDQPFARVLVLHIVGVAGGPPTTVDPGMRRLAGHPSRPPVSRAGPSLAPVITTTNVPAGMDISSSGRVSGPRVHPTRA